MMQTILPCFKCLLLSLLLCAASQGFAQRAVSTGGAAQRTVSTGGAAQQVAFADPARPDQQPQPSEVSLKATLSDLEAKHHVRFSYLNKLVDGKYVSSALLRQTDENVEKALLRILSPLALTFVKVGEQVYLITPVASHKPGKVKKEALGIEGGSLQMASLANHVALYDRVRSLYDKSITGKVTDAETGESLPGVNVVVKGTTIGTVTDIEGNYSLNVSDNAQTLVFSSVGYTANEVTIGSQSTIDIQMMPDVQALSEVVVVGYGTVKKSDLTGAVSSIDRQDVGNIAVTNVGQMIQGRAPGVNVISDGGLPGSGVKIKIRGTGTIYNSDPLYIINGMPGDINSVSPYDIERMEILKDASATAIYGARAANGVVLVTTKSGKAGQLSVTYNGYYGIATRAKKLDLLNADQYVDLVTDIISNTGQTDYTLPPKLQDDSYARTTRTDWQDAVFRRGAITEHHVNFSGGSDMATYSVSTGYTDMDASAGNYNYKRYNVMANSSFDLFDNRVTIGENVMVRLSQNNGNAPGFYGTLRFPPYEPKMDPDNLGGFSIVNSAVDLQDADNPLPGIFLNDREYRETKLSAQLFGEVRITDFLKFRSQYLFENSFSYDNSFVRPYKNGQNITTDRLEESYSRGYTHWLDNYLTFNKTFGIHDLSVMVGNSYSQGGQGGNLKVNATNFESYQVLLPTFGESAVMESGAWISSYLSYFGRINYSLLDRYLLTVNYRADASPNFSPSNRWGTFPSVALAWKVHEESFMDAITPVSSLKLRASWGKSGNDRIGSYQFLSNIYTGDNNNIAYPLGVNDLYTPGATINSLPATNIRWEESSSYNIGVDLGLFQNAVTLTAEYYDRLTDGILVRVPIPLSTGIDQAPFQNAASVRNKGMDLSLGYSGEVGTNLTYSVSAVAGFYRNNVESLGQGNPIFSANVSALGNTTLTDVGNPIGSFYGFQVDRVLVDDADAAAYLDTYGESVAGAVAGDLAFKDTNGDDVINDDDKTVIGNPNPDFNYGANFNVGYRNFDLQMQFTGVQGNDILNVIGVYELQGMKRPFNASTRVLDRWREQGQVTDIPRATANDFNNNLRISDRYIEDGSYLRLRNITLGYRLPIESRFLNSFRVYATAENVFTITNYSGYDPEITALDAGDANSYNLQQGIDNGQFPQPRRYFVGVQVNF